MWFCRQTNNAVSWSSTSALSSYHTKCCKEPAADKANKLQDSAHGSSWPLSHMLITYAGFHKAAAREMESLCSNERETRTKVGRCRRSHHQECQISKMLAKICFPSPYKRSLANLLLYCTLLMSMMTMAKDHLLKNT